MDFFQRTFSSGFLSANFFQREQSMNNRQNSVEIAIRLKDEVSAGLKAIQNSFKSLQATASSFEGGLPEAGKARAQVDPGAASWTAKAQADLDALTRTSQTDLDQAFAENTIPARFEQELEALRDKNRVELEELTAHGLSRTELLQSQSDTEFGIRQQQDKQERDLAADRLNFTHSFVGNMSDVMKELYESGLTQSQGVFRIYQALAVAETTISTYKSAQAAYAQGVLLGGVGGNVLGAVMAAATIAAGMARVATIKNTQPKGYAFGGLIGSHAGLIPGPDRGDRADNVTIRATPGEYMLDRPAVRHYGLPTLEALRRRRIPRSLLESFSSPALPASQTRTAYAFGGEIGTASLAPAPAATSSTAEDALTIINVMDFQREFDRALASARGRRILVNVLGEEGIG